MFLFVCCIKDANLLFFDVFSSILLSENI